MGRDRGSEIGAALAHEFHRVFRGDVLEDDLQLREPLEGGHEHFLEEDLLPIEDVDVGADHFAMDQERHPGRFHPLQHGMDVGDVGHAPRGVRRGPSGVELARGQHALVVATRDLVRVDRVGEVGRHERHEVDASDRLQDPLSVRARRRDGGHRFRQVGHHDGPPELPRGEGRDAPEHLSIAQMQVPVVGSAKRQSLGHGMQIRRPRPQHQLASSPPGLRRSSWILAAMTR